MLSCLDEPACGTSTVTDGCLPRLLQPSCFRCRGGRPKGRHGTKYTEEQEDAALLEDEEGVQMGHRLNVQPSVIKGGTMREYQLQGLNWLIHLYDNGINGILADEMVRAPCALTSIPGSCICVRGLRVTTWIVAVPRGWGRRCRPFRCSATSRSSAASAARTW